MGNIVMSDWKCACGGTVVSEHHQEWAGGLHGPGEWTTRKQREADPALAARCGHGGPAMWMTDEGWYTCQGCGRDLDGSEIAHVRATMADLWGRIMRGEAHITEEIGICVINAYAVARVLVDVDKKPVAAIRLEE